MDTVRPSELGVGDVVMVDCLVLKDEGDVGWTVRFELLSMSVLEKVPSSYVESQ